MKWIYLLAVSFLLIGCAKDIDIVLDHSAPKYVIEARISNLEGPYFVRITQTSNKIGSGGIAWNENDTAESVTNAQVILFDDTGVKDTLIPLDKSRLERYFYFYHDGIIDSMQDQFRSTTYIPERGYYQTTGIKGQPGHTYRLQVKIDSQVFEASAFMPMAPAIDSAVIKETAVMPNGLEGLLPFLFFSEPVNEKNYYLLQYNYISYYKYDIANASDQWRNSFPYYVVDDQLLPSYVNGLAVRITYSGHNPWGSNYNSVNESSPLQVRLSSLTKEAYEYYRVLISQFEEDGNVYKPVPASAVGNFSGGAFGLFYATHVSDKLILP